MRQHLWYIQYNVEYNSTIANNKKCSKFTELFKLCYSLLQLKIADPQELSPDFSKGLKCLLNLHNYSLYLWVL